MSNLHKISLRENTDQNVPPMDRYLKEVTIETKLIGHFFKKISLGIAKVITSELAGYIKS
jgi:hypothetical protein